MKIIIISGFLGAGKTTFIKKLIEETKENFVIMENEYGEVGIDGALLKEAPEEQLKGINIWEMTEGCVCCSMKADFATSVLTIANTFDPDYLIVEPTGVGLLENIIESIEQVLYNRIELLQPITILDANLFSDNVKDYEDIYTNQIKFAGTIVFSKAEGLSQEEIVTLEHQARELNPKADIETKHYSKKDTSWWRQLLSRKYHEDTDKKSTTAAKKMDIESMGFRSVELRSEDHLLLFLNCIVNGIFGNIVRAKGYLKAGEAWLRFDVVGSKYSITGMDEMPDSAVIFIGKNIKRDKLRKLFKKQRKYTVRSKAYKLK